MAYDRCSLCGMLTKERFELLFKNRGTSYVFQGKFGKVRLSGDEEGFGRMVPAEEVHVCTKCLLGIMSKWMLDNEEDGAYV